MYKFRVMYPDGKLLGEYNEQSEVDTCLHHSVPPGIATDRKEISPGSYHIMDKKTGKVLFSVYGPAPKEEGAGGQTPPANG